MSEHWYALHVKPHKERVVCNMLEAKGMRIYYPAVRVEPVNPRARRERPFFPGYLFVHVDLEEEGANTLRWSEGVHGLVEFGGVPATVPERLIDELKRQLELYQQFLASRTVYKHGDRIRIVEGLFAGYEAIFDAELPGRDRVQVLLTFLDDQPKRLQLNSSEITKKENRP